MLARRSLSTHVPILVITVVISTCLMYLIYSKFPLSRFLVVSWLPFFLAGIVGVAKTTTA